MIKKGISLIGAVMMSLIFMVSCDSLSGGGDKYETTESGLKYKLVERNEDARKIENGDILSLVMTYGKKDSVMFNTNQIPEGEMVFPLYEWEGCAGAYLEIACTAAEAWWRANPSEWLRESLIRYSAMLVVERSSSPSRAPAESTAPRWY